MTKELLRREFLLRRSALQAEELHLKNRVIAERALLHISSFSPTSIHTFLPQVGKHEINTMLIIGEIWRSLPNIQIIVPRVIPATRTMEHFLLTPETILIENKWGIPEPDPITSQKFDIQSIDFIFVPLLAFDTKGYRVGYGGGFYDRFFPQCKSDVIKTGLSFFDPVHEIDNLDKFDVALDYCITPFKTFQCRSSLTSPQPKDRP